MNTPLDELKAIGWTSSQILEAARQEIDREVPVHDPLAFQKAVQRVWERVRAGKPMYAQLEAQVAELEQELLTAQWGLAFLARNGESDLDRRFAQSVLDGKPMETIEEANDARLSHDTAEPHSEH